jgi:hypothetical protein
MLKEKSLKKWNYVKIECVGAWLLYTKCGKFASEFICFVKKVEYWIHTFHSHKNTVKFKSKIVKLKFNLKEIGKHPTTLQCCMVNTLAEP